MITATPELLVDWDILSDTAVRTKDLDYETEVGDVLQPTFYPQFKVKRWNNEFNFSMRPVLPSYVVDQLVTDVDTISARFGQIGFRFRIDPPEVDQSLDYPRGLGFEIIFITAPATNTLDFTVNTKGVRLIPQLPLSPEEIAAGANRPAHVDYSIAIYANKRHNQYGNGKIGHLYRPRIMQNDSTRSWGRWDVINQSLIRLSIAPALLVSGSYPIRIR